MDLKKLFGGGKKAKTKSEGATIDDLITLEQYDDAITLLKSRIKKNARDFRSQMQLANAYFKSGKKTDAIETYVATADGYRRDGFLDKSMAVLRKLERIAPGNEEVARRVALVDKAKRSEARGDAVSKDLERSGDRDGSEVVRLRQLWKNLTGTSMLVQLDDTQLKRLLGATRLEGIKEGAMLVEAGEDRQELFIVASGQIEAVFSSAPGKSVTLRSFGPGDVIGDRALLEHKPWVTGYRAAKDSELLKLDREALEKAMAGNPDPRALLIALRSSRTDRDVVQSVLKLTRSS